MSIAKQLVSDDGRATFTLYKDSDYKYYSVAVDFIGYEVFYKRFDYRFRPESTAYFQATEVINCAKELFESLVDHELIKDLDWGDSVVDLEDNYKDKLEKSEYHEDR